MSRTSVRRGRRIVWATVAGMVVSVALPPAAQAQHQDRYPYFWESYSETVYYWVDSNVPTGSWRSRITAGHSAWNAEVVDAEPYFNYQGTASVPSISDPCNAPGKGGVRREQLNDLFDDATAGATSWCAYDDGSITDFLMSFDTGAGVAAAWYIGTGTPAGDEMDLWSMASHEFGHATGWGPDSHWAETDQSICAENNTRRTMCSNIYPGDIPQRTLAAGDRTRLQAAYPH